MDSLLCYHSGSVLPQSSEEKTCIMLHGIFGMSSNLISLGKGLSEECATILYDLPNHGQSPRLPTSTFIEMATMLKRSIEAHCISQNIHLLGHSMGGKLALIFALLYPEMVGSLVMMDIAPVTYPPFHSDVIAGVRRVLQEQPPTKNEAIELLASFMPKDIAMFIAKSLVFEDGRLVKSLLEIETIAQYYDQLRSFPFGDMEGKVFEKEVLLLVAEHSDYFEEHYLSEVEKYCPGWELERVPHSGHNIHIDNFSHTCDTIKSFYQYG